MSDEPSPKRLYHYTCSHGIDSILEMKGKLVPNRMSGEQPLTTILARGMGYKGEGPVKALPVIWLTDINVQSADDIKAIGLVGPYSECDRVEYRFRVARVPSIQWWPVWADSHPEHVTDEWRRLIELGCKSERWWVADTPLMARLDERYQRP